MDYIHSPYFLTLAKELNFTRAAEKLFVSQQCLSAHIKRIEEFYGVALFERRPAVRLTHAGELLLKATQEVQDIEAKLHGQLVDMSENFSTHISIGISTNRALIYIPEFLARYQKRYPNIEVRLVEENVSSLEDKLFSNEIDFLIGSESWGQNWDISNVNTIVLLREQVYLLVSDELLERYLPQEFPQCKEQFLKGVSLSVFAHFPMILKSSNRIHGKVLQYFNERGIRPRIAIESSSNLALPLARRSVGVMICPQMRLAYFRAEQPDSLTNLNIFPLNDCVRNHQSVLRYHRDKYIPQYLWDAFTISQEIFQQLGVPPEAGGGER